MQAKCMQSESRHGGIGRVIPIGRKAILLLGLIALALGIACMVPAGRALADEPSLETDISKLNGTNWMSGISGDRYLHEINMPGTHDSSMCKLKVGDSLSGLVVMAFEEAAHTQNRYLDQQLEDGVRVFDLRLTDEAPYSSAQDGKSTWLCHGPTPAGRVSSFTFYAQDYADECLTFSNAMNYFTAFLEKHPTETLIVSVTNESGAGSKGEIFRRATKTIDRWADDTNEATGKSFVYKSSRGSILDEMPRLRDTRGQIVFVTDNVGYLQYGFQFSTGNGWGTTRVGDIKFAYENHYDTDNESKVGYVNALYNGGTVKKETFAAQKGKISTSIGRKLNHGISVLTTSNKFGKGGWWPESIAKYVNPRIFTNSDALMRTRGVFYGWVSVDFMTADIAKVIWMNNFPANGLDYATVAFDANGGTGSMAPITVQKGGTLTLPKCTFTGPGGKSFSEWKVGTEVARPGDVIDVKGNMKIYAQWGMTWKALQAQMRNAKSGDTITLESDVTALPTDSWLRIPKGKALTINLNGHTLNRNAKVPATGGRDFFYVEGDLTLVGPGKVTGGISAHGGGIFVADTGRVELRDVTVTGNAATLKGGGVYVERFKGSVGKLFVSGKTTITGNTLFKKGSPASNVWLASGAVIEVPDGKTLDSGTVISVLTEVQPTAAAPVYITGSLTNRADKANFASEGGYNVMLGGDENRAFIQATNKVTFVAGSAGAERTVMVATGGKVAKPTDPSKDGYVFKGWFKEGESAAYDFDTPVTANIVLRAKWGELRTVTFNSDGGSAVEAQRVAAGDIAAKPADPTKEGYAFKYWAQSVAAVVDGSFDYKMVEYDFSKPVERNILLKAVWEKESGPGGSDTPSEPHTVTFDVDGATFGTESVDHGGIATKPSPDPAKEGSAFAGWYEESPQTLSGPGYENIKNDPELSQRYWVFERGGEYYLRYPFVFDAQPITEDTTLYARWISSDAYTGTYTVTFDANEGTGAPSEQEGINYGGTATEPTGAPSKEKSHFAGWCSDQTCTKPYDFSTPVVSDITLYADWQPEEYIVSFVADDGVEGIDDQVVPYGGTVARPADPTLAGSVFGGWEALTLKEEGDSSYYEFEPYDFSTPVEEDLVLYASWTKDASAAFTVSFDALGGSPVPAAQSVACDGMAQRPAADPSREGYTFDGWYAQLEPALDDADAGSLRGDPDLSREYWIADDNHLRYRYEFELESVGGDLTLYARWLPNKNKVTFLNASDAEVARYAQTVESGSLAFEPDGWSSDRQVFAGWYADAARTVPFDFGAPITRDTTVYGKWVDALYNVTFDSNGGSAVSPQSQQVAYGKLAERPADPVLEGRTFRGWFENWSEIMTPEELETFKRDYLDEYESAFGGAAGGEYPSAAEVRAYLDENFIVEGGTVMVAYHPEENPVYSDLAVQALWQDGTLTVDVVIGEGAPQVEALNLAEVARGLVTDEELARGAHVWLAVNVLAEADVPAADKELLLKNASELGATPDMWLDIALYKEVGGETVQVHELATPLKLRLTVPEALRGTDKAAVRTFYLARAHGGEAAVILQGTGDALEGSSDRFSTHLLSHADGATAKPAAPPATRSSSALARTGDSLPAVMPLVMAVALAGTSCLAFAIRRRRD